MGVHLHQGHKKHRRRSDRLSRHAWILILMLVFAVILAFCGRSVSAQSSGSEELIETAHEYSRAHAHGGAAADETCGSKSFAPRACICRNACTPSSFFTFTARMASVSTITLNA